ncbi:hypothetical protein MKW94_016785 [Papaver nudicaule]|uniref:Uncharacterized protein n=1 Tax=Papaver nudicaule TaxID=74823 RepID=A0AA41VYX6_PAPNU|nr:hypothetical protein [Papaver nudicaule]
MYPTSQIQRQHSAKGKWIPVGNHSSHGDTYLGSKNSTVQPRHPLSQIQNQTTDELLEQYENVSLGDTSAGSKNSAKQPIYPTSQIQRQHSAKWIRHGNHSSQENTYEGSKNSTKQPIYPTSQIQRQHLAKVKWIRVGSHSSHEHTSEGSKNSTIQLKWGHGNHRSHEHTSEGSKNSSKQPIYPTSQIQKQPTDEWIDEWIERYENRSLLDAYAGSKNSTKQPIYPISQIQKQSIDLKVSLQMFLHEATSFASDWKDVNRKYDDRRSFPTFLWLLQMFGLDWHKYIVSEDNDINFSNQPNRWSCLQAPLYDVVHLRPELTLDPNWVMENKLTQDSNWVMANKYYGRSLSLMRLLQRIRSESGNDFSQKQAELLEPFLSHLIRIQQEQRVVAYSFSGHLEQLRKSNAASSVAFSSNAVEDDGDSDKCPFILSKHTMDYSMWQQKHLFDSLYIISRESTWLLRKLEDSHLTSPSFIKESHRILEIVVLNISKFKKSKELLDQYLLDNLLGWPFIEDEVTQLVQENEEILDLFGTHINRLQEAGVGKGSVIEDILDCLGDICKISMDGYGEKNSSSSLALGDVSKISMDGYGEKNSSSSLSTEYTKAFRETMELIKEASKKLSSYRFSTLTGGSPLGNITLWRILFESSLVDLRLDLISKKHGEVFKLWVKISNSGEYKCPDISDFLRARFSLHREISSLLSAGDSLLFDFLAMHRTLAETTYMLCDAFTTGGAGMNELSDEISPGSSSKYDKEMEMVQDFPWDKHNVLNETKVDLNDPKMRLLDYPCFDYYSPDSYTGFT